jgi:hypothetical protein
VNIKDHLEVSLYAIHPAVHKISTEFFHKYNRFRLIDFDKLKATVPLSIEDFTLFIRRQCDANADHLNMVWVNDCAQVIQDFQNQIENIMPGANNVTLSIFIKPYRVPSVLLLFQGPSREENGSVLWDGERVDVTHGSIHRRKLN